MSYAGGPPEQAGARVRAQRIQGLRELADFLAAHPAVPVPDSVTVAVYRGSDADQAEVVARAGHHLGVKPLQSFNGTYRAARRFAGLSFAVVHVPTHGGTR